MASQATVHRSRRNREYTEQYAKSTNNCGDFELNVVDAFGEGVQQTRAETDDRQITFEELEI